MANLLTQWEKSQNNSHKIGDVVVGTYHIQKKYRVVTDEKTHLKVKIVFNRTRNRKCRKQHMIAGDGQEVRVLITAIEGHKLYGEVLGTT